MITTSRDEIWEYLFRRKYTAPVKEIELPSSLYFNGERNYWKYLYLVQPYIKNYYKFKKMAKWEDDATALVCCRCKNPFSMLRRKHHCRSCGQIFCDPCTQSKTSLPNMNIVEKVRVCDECLWISSVLQYAPQKDKILRICVIGERFSGKSCMIQRFINDTYMHLDPTQGASIFKKKIDTSRGNVQIEIWDTSGIFSGNHSNYFKSSNVVLLVANLNDPGAINSIKNLYEKIVKEKPDQLFALAGTKNDIKAMTFDNNKIEQFVLDRGIILYNEVNSVSGDSVHSMFRSLAENNLVFDHVFKK
jgi:hypothetical protein